MSRLHHGQHQAYEQESYRTSACALKTRFKLSWSFVYSTVCLSAGHRPSLLNQPLPFHRLSRISSASEAVRTLSSTWGKQSGQAIQELKALENEYWCQIPCFSPCLLSLFYLLAITIIHSGFHTHQFCKWLYFQLCCNQLFWFLGYMTCLSGLFLVCRQVSIDQVYSLAHNFFD